MSIRALVASDRTDGRILVDMLELGHRCGLHKVERLMGGRPLRASPKCRAKPLDRGDHLEGAIGGDLLDRQFLADLPNKKSVVDFT